MSTSAVSNATTAYVLLTICVTLTTLSGCGGSGGDHPTSRITGRITIDGQPIATGSLYIYPRRPGQGEVVVVEIVDGQYVAEEAPHGYVLVQFMATEETGRMIPGSGSEVPEILSIIPEQYQPGIYLSIEGDMEHDFEMVSQ